MSSASGYLGAVVSAIENAASELAGVIPASTPIATVAGVKLTWGSIRDLVALVEAIPTADLKAMLANAGDVDNDAQVAADIAETIALATPYSGEVDAVVEVIKWLVENSTARVDGTPMTPDYREAGR